VSSCSAVVSTVSSPLTLCSSSGRPAEKIVLPSSSTILPEISGQSTPAKKSKRPESSSAVDNNG